MVEVECDDLEQVVAALEAGADRIMLDNMTIEQVREAVGKVAGATSLEYSGRVTLDTVAEFAATGVDFISVGALTHSAPVLDVGLDFA